MKAQKKNFCTYLRCNTKMLSMESFSNPEKYFRNISILNIILKSNNNNLSVNIV